MKNFENLLFVLKTVLMSLVGQKRLPQTFSCAKNQKNFQNFWIFFFTFLSFYVQKFNFPLFESYITVFLTTRNLHKIGREKKLSILPTF